MDRDRLADIAQELKLKADALDASWAMFAALPPVVQSAHDHWLEMRTQIMRTIRAGGLLVFAAIEAGAFRAARWVVLVDVLSKARREADRGERPIDSLLAIAIKRIRCELPHEFKDLPYDPQLRATHENVAVVTGSLNGIANLIEMELGTTDDLNTAEGPIPDRRPPRVFICHMDRDARIAINIYNNLKAAGAVPWVDKQDLVHGDEWEVEIKKAVREADAFVVCLRPEFDDVGVRQKEVRLAMDEAEKRPPGRGFIIPFLVETCELPEWCRRLHAGPDLDRPTTLEELVRAIEKHCQWKRSRASERPGGTARQ